MTKSKAPQEKGAEESKRGRGRPTVYRVESVKTVRDMASRGWTEIEMAAALSIDVVTFRRWKVKYPDFCQASEPSEDEKRLAVTRALFSRATGYSHQAVKIMTRSIGEGCSEIVREEYVEHYPPDVAAIRYFLNNKSKGEFKDTQEVEQRGDVVVRVEGGLPDKEPEK